MCKEELFSPAADTTQQKGSAGKETNKQYLKDFLVIFREGVEWVGRWNNQLLFPCSGLGPKGGTLPVFPAPHPRGQYKFMSTYPP